jgi:hypothetical protein
VLAIHYNSILISSLSFSLAYKNLKDTGSEDDITTPSFDGKALERR